VAARLATGGATGAASGALGTCELAIALVADSGKELCDLLTVAGGTNDLFISKRQNLKILVALGTVVLKNGHVIVSLSNR
jgi:hypothetical protein